MAPETELLVGSSKDEGMRLWGLPMKGRAKALAAQGGEAGRGRALTMCSCR